MAVMTIPTSLQSLLDSLIVNRTSWSLGIFMVVATSVWFAVASFGRGRRRRRRQRSWSFTSSSMVLGAFPKRTRVPETIINVAVFFDEPPTNDDLAQSTVCPMLEYERLSTIPDPACWDSPSRRRGKGDGELDPADMVRRLVVYGDDRVTVEIICRHLQDPLQEDDGRRGDLPWWEWLVVENRGPGSSACVLRIHHSLADGISLVNVFEKIITHKDGTPLCYSAIHGKRSSSSPPLASSWGTLVMEFFRVVTLGATRFDDDTAFSKSIRGDMVHSGNRSHVIFPEVPLDFVKRLKNAAGCTVNDVLMTCLSQAIHDYCIDEDCPVLSAAKNGNTPVQCRALLPVALPRSEEEFEDKSTALRNRWCFVSIDLGVGSTDIVERLRHVRSMTQEMKASPRAAVQMAVQNTIPPLLPLSLGRQTLFDVFSRHSLVFSNVPGPDRPCLLAGKVATGVQMFYANLIPQIGLLSYAGTVYGNMILDPDAVPNADRIAHFYGAAFVHLAERLQLRDVPPELAKASTMSANGKASRTNGLS